MENDATQPEAGFGWVLTMTPLCFLGMNVLELKFRSYKTGFAMAMAKSGVESVGTCTPMGPESLGFGAGCSAFFSIKLLIKYVDVDDT